MKTKKILGLDLGTNSIGWALIEQDFENKKGNILGMDSRIIPMTQDVLDTFGAGKPSKTQTAERTGHRSARRIRERYLLRRERLHRVLNVLGFLPGHYADEIDFTKHFGQFKDETEPKLAWKKNGKKVNGKDKFDFLFQESFKEMLEDFVKNQPTLLNRKNNKGEDAKIPYDWTIYYLRKKAITKKISKEELAWLILNFNQKRGYYELRSEDEEVNDLKKEFVIKLKVVKIEKGEVDKRNDKKTWYAVTFENNWKHSFPFTSEPNWLNTEREFLVVEEYDDEGNIKIVKDRKKDTEGREKRTISPLPSFEEIDLMSKKEQDKIYKKIKAKTELTISNSGKTVGTYIYDTLLQKPNQKIRGKLIRTIERIYYKDELKQILQKQIALQPELFTEEKYSDCVRELYRSNEVYQQQLNSKNDFVHLFLDDIIFYQRPLRSQKSSIGNCSLEFRLHKVNKKDEKGNPIKNVFEKDENGKDIEIKEYLKAIPKSNPYYQEFRIWQWMKNLSIYQKEDDKNVTADFLNSEQDFEDLFKFLDNRKEIEQKPLIEFLVGQKENKNRQPLPENATKTAIKKAETEFKKKVASETEKYRWNYVEDKKYPCNETKTKIVSLLNKVSNVPKNFLTREIEQQLWHIVYSVTDKNQFENALETFAKKYGLYHVPKSEQDSKNPDKKCFVENFKKFPPFPSEYGSFSEKAIKKLLPLMRLGNNYWNVNDITNEVISRANAISERLKTITEINEIENIADDDIPKQILKSFFSVTDLTQGLRIHQASYLVYGRHSEAEDAKKWNSINDLKTFLKEFKQHSLRNPIVEQVVTETLRVVQDIWEHPQYGNGQNNFFDEIHIELGREMKNPKDDRERMTKQITENENTNHRIKLLLAELKNDSNIEGVREYSPSQQEILKIYEDGVLSKYSEQELKSEKTDLKKDNKDITIYDISKSAQPSKSELTRYKLWLEQKYRSPYTGKAIPLSKLFTSAYQIEHIIPQSRYFDDSFSNKVICEAAVNKLKDNLLGLEFIKKYPGQKVEIGLSETVEIFSEEAYKNFVKEHYEKNRSKRNKLLLEEIPEKMIERQMNDTRYISKFISNLLSNIVRDINNNDDGINSKNLIPGNGKITSVLKQDWGLNDVWNELILPRFERMNKLTNTISFTAKNKEGHTIPAIPLDLSKGFQKKRIDHRHHAMDALVIACATQTHINYLNNTSAKVTDTKSEEKRRKQIEYRNQLKNGLCFKSKPDEKGNYKWIFKKPWENFTTDAKNELEKIVVSFKQNLRVINKATNQFESYKDEKGNLRIGKDGKPVKGLRKQVKTEKGVNWAIRKPMHEETVSGKVKLPWVKLGKGEFTTASRKALDKSFNEEKIRKITDMGIQKILLKYFEHTIENTESLKNIRNQILDETTDKKKKELESKLQKETAEKAFSPEGIEDLNKNIIIYNDGKYHQPIYKVRTYEKGKGRFVLGNTGNKKSKYVQGAPNLFFVAYERTDSKERLFDTVPLNEVIEHQKQQIAENVIKEKRTDVPIKRFLEKGDKEVEVNYLFYLSPNDLVYVPTHEEKENINGIDFRNLSKEQKKRIFNVNDFSGNTCYFTPNRIAKAIREKEVDMSFDEKKNKTSGSFDIKTASFEGEQIKEVCIKIQVDRLGNIHRAK